MKPIIVKPGSNAFAANLHQIRKTKHDFTYDSDRKGILSFLRFYENVSMIAFEGSTLTMMGLVKYNAEEKAF